MSGFTLTPQQFQEQSRQAAKEQRGIQYDETQTDEARQENAAQDLLTNILLNLSGKGAVSRGRTQGNIAQQQGFQFASGGPDGGILNNRQTLQPLPFDEYYSKTANFAGVVRSVQPELYGLNQQVLGLMNSMVPEAVRALKTQETNIYEGVPQNFFINRVNIALQRKRENDMYAFK